MNVLLLLLLLLVVGTADAFQRSTARIRPLRHKLSKYLAINGDDSDGPRVLRSAPFGRSFLAAEVGVPSANEDFGGGDVGGNDYQDALYQCGVRKDVPPITQNAVVKVPDMRFVERGYSEAKAAAAYAAAKYKTGPWSKEEDEKLTQLFHAEKDGVRGRWVRISKVMQRTPNDCSLRWMQVLSPNIENNYKDIVRDNEYNCAGPK